jgi:phospholipid/cholesterol/gamma-HCH transport system permease protein
MKFMQSLLDWITGLGYATRYNAWNALTSLSRYVRFMGLILTNSGDSFRRPRLTVTQIHMAGNRSLAIIGVSGLFVGFVLSLQLYNLLARYGSADLAGLAVNLALVRELGPVVTALLFAGRAGTALTAEIGLMKAGDQLTAMSMMGVNPVRRIMTPRFWGGFISMPLLAAVFSVMGLLGAWLIVVVLVGADSGGFWSQMQSSVDWWHDIGQGFLKSVAFGGLVTSIALFVGYESDPTPEGVANATTKTVVISSLAVLALDFMLTAFMF